MVNASKTVTVSLTIYSYWVCVFGFPEAILSDQGSNFESHLIRALCAVMGSNETCTTP